MKPETEQLLGTIEVLLKEPLYFSLPDRDYGATLEPYVWDSTLFGPFTPLNLIKVEGWIKQTDPEIAIENWQWSEQTGLAAKGQGELDDLCEEDEEEILLDEETKQVRAQNYQKLLNFINANLQDIKAYTISYNLDYSLSVIVWQLPNLTHCTSRNSRLYRL